MNYKTLPIIVLLLLAFDANAQRWTTADGDPALNPNSGIEVDPTFCYDPSDGLFYIFNAGPNGIDDTTSSGIISGDDFGLNTLSISYQGVNAELVQPAFGNGLTWTASQFGGRVQLGVSPSLFISESPFPILRLDTGLTADAFRAPSGFVDIELGSGPFGGPGQTIFAAGDAAETGAFKIVPEPSALCIILGGGLMLVGLHRRRR